MTYKRVIPRDLFNEANLLKCYGQLYLELEKLGMEDCLIHVGADGPFVVQQFEGDGSTYLLNVQLHVREQLFPLYRPLNSREPYPLWMTVGEDEDEIAVFNDDGSFTEEMIAFLRDVPCN